MHRPGAVAGTQLTNGSPGFGFDIKNLVYKHSVEEAKKRKMSDV